MEKKVWEDCLFIEGEQDISEHFSAAEGTLLILGKGFDPRQCRILEKLKPSVRELTVFLVNYNEQATVRDDMRNESRSRKNYETFKKLTSDLKCNEVDVPMYRGNIGKKNLVISESVRSALSRDTLKCYKNIAVDISAMPKGVGFSVIKRLVDLRAEYQKIYILVCENSQYDDKIKPVIASESAEFLPGFNRFFMDMDQDNNETIWFPVLGFQEDAFSMIADYLKPIEICPVVPFPSRNIRRGENILRSCGNLLFQEYAVERRNIIYVPENNPLLVYQKLYDTVMYYEKAFQVDGNMTQRYAFSAQSSKLIDIGMLLAMMDLGKKGIKVGVVVVETNGYTVDEEYKEENEELYCLCLNDTVYDW